MKTIRIILTSLCAFALSTSASAQFNTIGTYQHKRIKTTNPPKPSSAPMDSISLADSIPADSATNNLPLVGKGTSAPLVSLPLKNIRITSGYGMHMHPIYHKRMMHNGVDLSARLEQVYSMLPGTVIRVGQDDRSGKFVTVKTGDYTISYCHLSAPLVKSGTFVNAGDILAISGNTGASTNFHLHLTAKKDGKPFNAAILLEYIQKIQNNVFCQ